jgi:hypothetical protein
LQLYAEQGFLAIPAFCSAADVVWMRGTLLRLFEKRAGRDEGNQFDMLGLDVDPNLARQPQIIKPSVFAPALLRTAYFERLVVVARQLLGPDARFSFDHSILKPAASAAATPWHQDEAHHDHRHLRYAQVSFWLALQDTPLGLGCMRYIPQSDRGPLLAHRRVDDDPRVHALECPTSLFDESLAVAEPVTAGSCILHDGRTLHSALPNVSDRERLAYIVAFTGPPVRCDKPHLAPSSAADHTASIRRRQRWLLRGGVLVHLLRRLRRGLRSSPRWHWRKLRTLARTCFTPGRSKGP